MSCSCRPFSLTATLYPGLADFVDKAVNENDAAPDFQEIKKWLKQLSRSAGQRLHGMDLDEKCKMDFVC